MTGKMRNQSYRSGTILASVLVVVAMSAMIAAGLMYTVRAETLATETSVRVEQASAAATSGLHTALAVLKTSMEDPSTWQDNPELFANILVCDDGANKWYFSVYSPSSSDSNSGSESIRFGLSDEGGKINLNVASKDMLSNLGVLSPQQVDCLIDYRDVDDDSLPLGAEQRQYDFPIRNMPMIWTLEELLLIKNFDATTVYGEDANFNGLLDPNENDSNSSFPPDNGDGVLDRGLRDVLTTDSYGYDVDASGKPRVNINGKAEDLADAGLDKETIDFITIYRQESGNDFSHPSELLNMSYTYKEEVKNRRGKVISQTDKTIDSGIDANNLAGVLDRFTAREGKPSRRVRDLINITTANASVLQAVFISAGVDEAVVGAIVGDIITARDGIEMQTLTTPAWLVSEGVVDEAIFKKIAPKLCSSSLQYHFFCIGFGSPCGQFVVFEVILDFGLGEPRIAYMRNVTRLGMPQKPNLDGEEINY